MATTRVYILAKELSVKSSAIIKKCQEEELDVKNHMSTISAGLAATIREWFSEGENVTAVETTEKVDLKKVRVKRKKAKKAKKPAEQETDEAVAETPEVSAIDDSSATAVAEPETPSAEQVEAVVEDEPKTEPEPEPEPEPIIPAGPMLGKPAPAKLSGPNVIRVEEPEPESSHGPRHKRRHSEPATQPLMGAGEGVAESTKSTGKQKTKTHGRRKGETNAEAERRAKFMTQRRQRDLEERKARLSAAGGEGFRVRPSRRVTSKRSGADAAALRPQKVTIAEPITVKSLSSALAVKATDIITKLMQQGTMATANQNISSDIAELAAIEFGVELTIVKRTLIEEEIRKEFEERPRNNLTRRSVVATMLGHVDHGKTSLLDKIRQSDVQSGEAGGITQHIGASRVKFQGQAVTFLDTPGHEAFTAMRSRGANMTDVVILVVAADDGVMPQTAEAINHAKAAGVPVLIALNKTDLPGCDINRIYAQFAERELTPQEWGGETDVVKTSATTGEGVEELLEHLEFTADLLDLKADDTIPATGWVVEAKMDSQRGPVATLLIKEGVLKKGDIIFADSAYGRIKMLRDSKGKSIKKASSSMPVEITGLNGVPQAGDRFYVLSDINRAKDAAQENQTRQRENALAERTQVTMENLFSQIEAGNVKELNIIIRADVQGSVDVLIKYLSDLSTEEVKIKILHAAPGGVTEGDVILAEASNALIIGFNVIADDMVARIAEDKGVDIRFYNVIYRITEDLQQSMVGLLEPEEQEKSLGRAVVRNTFKVSRIGTIAGCYVNDGVAAKSAKVRLIRDNVVIRDNLKIDSLKHFKDDVRDVKSGLECGIKINKFDDIKVDDILDFYEIVQVARTL